MARSRMPLALALLYGVGVGVAAAQAPAPRTLPAPGPGQILVVSVPAGLNAYIASRTEIPMSVSGSEVQAELDGAFRPVGVRGSPESLGPLFAERFLVGRTPLVVDRPPGEYRVGVAQPLPRSAIDTSRAAGLLKFTADLGEAVALQADIGGRELVVSDHNDGVFVDFRQRRAGSFPTGWPRFSTTGSEILYGKYYDVLKMADTALSVVALFPMATRPGDGFAAQYPAGQNFRFDAAALRADLVQREADAARLTAALALLRRGGKAIVPARAGALVVEVTPAGRWAITPIRQGMPD